MKPDVIIPPPPTPTQTHQPSITTVFPWLDIKQTIVSQADSKMEDETVLLKMNFEL